MMRSHRLVQDSSQDTLLQAIARNAAAVLSLPSAGILRHHKSRFLAMADDSLWIEAPAEEAPLVNELLTTQKPCGISFKSGVLKIVFGSPALEWQPQYKMNDDLTVSAIRVAFPKDIKSVQRRNNYRVGIPLEAELKLKISRMTPGAGVSERPIAAQIVQSQLRDLSIGGMGVILKGNEDQPPKISVDDRLRIEITYRADEPLLIEGYMRHPVGKITQKQIRAGIQFKEYTNDITGRRTLAALTRIVGELQREEVRRLRITATSAA